MVKAVLFDMDGVLIDSLKTHFYAFNTAIVKFGAEDLSLETFRRKFWGKYVKQNVQTLFGDISDQKLIEIVEEYTLQMSEFSGYISVYPDTTLVLREFKKKNLMIGLITSSPKRTVDRILDQMDLDGYFDIIICGDQIKRPKPAVDGIIEACNFLRIKPSETIYVGDTYLDIVAGKSAGCYTVGITTCGSKQKLKGADSITNNLRQLLDLEKQLATKK